MFGFSNAQITFGLLDIADVGPVVLADTVGFIKQLPHKLVEAFKATLEETIEADLLIHVVDCASDEREDNIDQVNAVLKEIDADEKPQLLVFNKIDILGAEPRIDYEDGIPKRVWVSARDAKGFDLLIKALSEVIGPDIWQGKLKLPLSLGTLPQQLRAQLFELNAIESESYDELGSLVLSLRLQEPDRQRLIKQLELDWPSLSGQAEAKKEPWE